MGPEAHAGSSSVLVCTVKHLDGQTDRETTSAIHPILDASLWTATGWSKPMEANGRRPASQRPV